MAPLLRGWLKKLPIQKPQQQVLKKLLPKLLRHRYVHLTADCLRYYSNSESLVSHFKGQFPLSSVSYVERQGKVAFSVTTQGHGVLTLVCPNEATQAAWVMAINEAIFALRFAKPPPQHTLSPGGGAGGDDSMLSSSNSVTSSAVSSPTPWSQEHHQGRNDTGARPRRLNFEERSEFSELLSGWADTEGDAVTARHTPPPDLPEVRPHWLIRSRASTCTEFTVPLIDVGSDDEDDQVLESVPENSNIELPSLGPSQAQKPKPQQVQQPEEQKAEEPEEQMVQEPEAQKVQEPEEQIVHEPEEQMVHEPEERMVGGHGGISDGNDTEHGPSTQAQKPAGSEPSTMDQEEHPGDASTTDALCNDDKEGSAPASSSSSSESSSNVPTASHPHPVKIPTKHVDAAEDAWWNSMALVKGAPSLPPPPSAKGLRLAETEPDRNEHLLNNARAADDPMPLPPWFQWPWKPMVKLSSPAPALINIFLKVESARALAARLLYPSATCRVAEYGGVTNNQSGANEQPSPSNAKSGVEAPKLTKASFSRILLEKRFFIHAAIACTSLVVGSVIFPNSFVVGATYLYWRRRTLAWSPVRVPTNALFDVEQGKASTHQIVDTTKHEKKVPDITDPDGDTVTTAVEQTPCTGDESATGTVASSASLLFDKDIARTLLSDGRAAAAFAWLGGETLMFLLCTWIGVSAVPTMIFFPLALADITLTLNRGQRHGFLSDKKCVHLLLPKLPEGMAGLMKRTKALLDRVVWQRIPLAGEAGELAAAIRQGILSLALVLLLMGILGTRRTWKLAIWLLLLSRSLPAVIPSPFSRILLEPDCVSFLASRWFDAHLVVA